MRTAAVETCEQCRFDAGQYGLQDALGTARALGPMWAQTVEGVDPEILATPAAPGQPSVDDHAVAATALISHMTDELRTMAPGTSPTTDRAAGAGTAPAGFGAATRALHDVARSLGPARSPAWRATSSLDGVDVDAGWLLRHGLHAGIHHLREAGRALHLLGAGAPGQSGTVAQINRSDGGVPKVPMDEAEIGERGVLGDRQAAREHHGRPLQALCLWSVEVIDDLRAEGHPIFPGAAGENLTLAGLDWATIRPGTRLRIGEVLADASAYAVPCKKNAGWFAGGDFLRMSHDRHPGWSRLYAWVLEPGRVRQGDQVLVEP
jgi:MOSC domain-containing protein YiiM